MLRKAFVISSICISIIIFLFLLNLFIITKKDLKNFNKSLQKGFDIKSQSAYQERKDVKKDLYIVENDIRKYYIISSDFSKIFLNRKNQTYELVENLDNITLFCFENIYSTKLQNIKHMTAQKGYYYFPSQIFELKDVNINFINASNFQKLDFNNAYFTGHASELHFSIKKKKPVIEAITFDGSIDPKKGFKCEK
jgi:hypothetical protein